MAKRTQAIRNITHPLYHYYQAVYLSFFSPRIYVDVANRWKGIGFLYLMFVLILASIPLTARMIIDFNRYFDQAMIYPVMQLPPLMIQNGIVSLDKPMPYIIKNSQGDIVSIVDTTGTINAIDHHYPHLAILITKNKIAYRPPKMRLFFNQHQSQIGDAVYEQTLDENDNEVFDVQEWFKSSHVGMLKHLGQFLMYPLVLSVLCSAYLIVTLLFALLGQLVAQLMFSTKLKFKETCRLLSVAVTPQLMIFIILLTCNLVLPWAGIVYTSLIAGYFSFAVFSVNRSRKSMVII